MRPEEFRSIRERLGMTQVELAEALGLRSGGTFVSAMERGTRGISEQTATQLRQLLELHELRGQHEGR